MSPLSNKTIRLIAISLLALSGQLLSGCASNPLSADTTSQQDTAVIVPAKDLSALHQQALVQMDAERWHAARDSLTKITEQNPTLSGPWVNLGITRTKLGDHEGAEAAFKSALAANSDNSEAYNQLGMLYRRHGRFEEAQFIYEEALHADPNNANVHWNIAILYDRYVPNPHKSLQHYQRYQKITGANDAQLLAWIAEMQKRNNGENMTAKVKP